MRQLSNQSVILLVSGFVIGLVLGMVAVGANDDLRESLFGTSGGGSDSDNVASVVDTNYYLVDLETANAWVSSQYEGQADALKTAVDELNELPQAVNFKRGFVQASEAGVVDALMLRMYGALNNVPEAELDTLVVDKDNPLVVCLGSQDDLYGDLALYIYIEIPAEEANKLALDDNDNWEQRRTSMESEMYWTRLACLPDAES